MLPLASVALVVAGVLALRVGAFAPVRFGRTPRRRPPADAPGPLGLLIPLWRDSRLFRLLSISALLCGSLGPMLYFQFAYLADLATRGANAELRLLSLYAAVRGGLNVLVLLLQLLMWQSLLASTNFRGQVARSFVSPPCAPSTVCGPSSAASSISLRRRNAPTTSPPQVTMQAERKML